MPTSATGNAGGAAGPPQRRDYNRKNRAFIGIFTASLAGAIVRDAPEEG